MTAQELERIWAATEYLGETQQRDLALLHILSHGLRAGEIVSLNVGAFDGMLIFVADTKTNEPRLVPLRKQSREALKEYLSWRESQGEEITSDRSIFRTVATKFATLSLRYPSSESEQISPEMLGLRQMLPFIPRFPDAQFNNSRLTGCLLDVASCDRHSSLRSLQRSKNSIKDKIR